MSEGAIAGIIMAIATLVSGALVGIAKVRAAGQTRSARAKDAGKSTSILPPPPAPYAARAEHEALARQVADLSGEVTRSRERIAACEASVEQIQEEQKAQLERIHEVDMRVVEKIGEHAARVAELSGAIKQATLSQQGPLSQRGGGRR